MTVTWYCTDCEKRLDREDVDAHETKGHHVHGHLRPDRLLPGDPWSLGARSEQGGTE